MPKLRLYIETSVWSHWYAEDAPERRDQTRAYFTWCQSARERLALFVSPYVLEEFARADPVKEGQLEDLLRQHMPTILQPDEDVRQLAAAYAEHGAIPAAKKADALHVAIATVNEADVLVSWNYRHLVNVRRETMINAVNQLLGYARPLRIATPAEVIEDEIQ